VAEGDPAAEGRIIAELGVNPFVARLLVNRGITTPDSARLFIDAPLDSLLDPMTMTDMDKAVDRVIAARERKEKIVVYGDYDVDGVTATAILLRFFRAVGMETEYYIPLRAKEGYGLNIKALEQIAAAGARLVITVDTGINDLEAVANAAGMGLDVIVTDHHRPGDALPQAVAVLNPDRDDCPYECKSLSGAGVAFKLCMAVRRALGEKWMDKTKLPNLKRYLDMVAISAIADVTSLTGENRILALRGIEELDSTDKPGLDALKSVVMRDSGAVSARDIGFGIAPALNSAGRLGRADVGVELLLTEDKNKAFEIARFLEKENARRKDIQRAMLEEALAMAEKTVDPEKDRVVVLASDSWKSGVAGIVASQIVDRYHMPTALVCFENGMGKGSARSIPSFNITSGLGMVGDVLEKFGGHDMAAGFTVRRENFEAFKSRLLAIAEKEIRQDDLRPIARIDGEADVSCFDIATVRGMLALAPFGEGNPSPVFLARGVSFDEARYMGPEGQHVRLLSRGAAQAVGFNMARLFPTKEVSDTLYDIVFSPEINVWANIERVQLRLIDVRKSSGKRG